MSAELGKEPQLFLSLGHCGCALNKGAPVLRELRALTLRHLSVSHSERHSAWLAQRQKQVRECHLRKGSRGLLILVLSAWPAYQQHQGPGRTCWKHRLQDLPTRTIRTMSQVTSEHHSSPSVCSSALDLFAVVMLVTTSSVLLCGSRHRYLGCFTWEAQSSCIQVRPLALQRIPAFIHTQESVPGPFSAPSFLHGAYVYWAPAACEALGQRLEKLR